MDIDVICSSAKMGLVRAEPSANHKAALWNILRADEPGAIHVVRSGSIGNSDLRVGHSLRLEGRWLLLSGSLSKAKSGEREQRQTNRFHGSSHVRVKTC